MGLPSQCSAVADEKDQKRRWAGYVCPDCRMVFRVPRDHDGHGVVCPSCRRMLRLPGADDVPPPLMAESIRRIEMPLAPEAAVRKRSSGNGLSHTSWILIGSTLGLSLVATVALLIWFRSDSPGTTQFSQMAAQVPVVNLNPIKVPEPSAPKESLSGSDPAVIKEAADLAERFLKADTVEALLPIIYHPEISEPRIRAYYSNGGKFSKGATLTETPSAPNVLKPLLLSQVQDENLDLRTLAIHLTPAGPKVDWESWVAWSEISWQDFKNKRPTEPKLIRVKAYPVNYYNFDFNEESKWQSYTLRSADENDVVYGYVLKNSQLDAQMQSFVSAADSGIPLTLLLKYPADAKSSSQVLIDSMVHQDWTEKKLTSDHETIHLR